jgi:transposase-like protein
MAIGIDTDGNKDVLEMYIGEHETSKIWLTVLNKLMNRGVEDIMIYSVDNLTVFSEAITACFRISKSRSAPSTESATLYAMCLTRTPRSCS